MQTEAHKGTRSSFFDDDDLSISFQFTKPENFHQKDLNQPTMLKDTLINKVSGSDTQSEGFYAVHNRILAYYKNASSKIPEGILNLAFCKLKALNPTEEIPYYGFLLTKNDYGHEFYSPDKQVVEDWIEVLKDICVLSTFHDDYKALKMIGRGSFAKVYLVESKATGKMYAVKAFTKEGIVISNKNNAKPSMLNEIDIMRSLDHENIIKLYEVHESENSIYLVLELIQGKALQEALKKPTFKEEYSEIKLVNMIRSILDALAYLAAKGIMHRDLKPDNILLDKESKIKIADFGLATLIDLPEYIFKKCGTPGYIAPEVFKYDQKNSATNYNDRSDVFSAGCILFYMLFGFPFFEGSNGSEILRLNRKFTLEFDSIYVIKQEMKNANSKISKDALHLLLQLLELDPKKRISADEALSHPYFIPVPNGMLKVLGTNDLISDPNSKSNLPSPTKLGNKRGSQALEHLTISKTDALQSPGFSKNKDRFTKKNSFYLDMGKPELNGRVDTIATGSSTNNSVLLQKRDSTVSVGSGNSPDSPSSFSKQKSLYQRSRSLKPYNPVGNTGQSFLKAAIFRNMAKNNGDMANEESKEDDLRIERRPSELPFERDSDSDQGKDCRSPDRDDYSSDNSLNNSPLGMEKLHLASPSKVGQSKKKRFQPFAQKDVKEAK